MKPGTPGRPPACVCGDCRACRHAAYMREYWRGLSAEKRAEVLAKRRKPTLAENQARYARRKADPAFGLKKAARTAISNAIRDGRLERQSCEVCGDPATDAHHEDYGKLLEVRWLCRAHHNEEHRIAA